MIKATRHFAYGLKLIATWMLIPFVLFFVPLLAIEFKQQFTTQEVTLMDQTYSGYPDEYWSFKTDINGRERAVQAPVGSKTGDTVTVILRNGEYYLTPFDSEKMDSYMTFIGRFMRVCNNNFGLHVIGIAAVLLITFLLTITKTKDIRAISPKLSKVTDLGGMIVSSIVSFALLFGVIEGSLTGLAIAYLGLFLGIAYTAIFVIAWFIQSLIIAFAK